MRSFLLLIVAAAVAGCAVKQPQMTRDEYLQTTQRTYEARTPDDIFRAAEKLFRLADGDDFAFHHTDDSMTATRPWLVYLVLAASSGTDTWVVRTQQEGDATKVSALVSTVAGSILPMPTTGGDFTAGGLPAGGNLVAGTAIYDVFWARMDYLLGLGNDWMTCDEADARVRDGTAWGNNEALCNGFNMKDDLPEGIGPDGKPTS